MARPSLRLRNPNLPATGKSSGVKGSLEVTGIDPNLDNIDSFSKQFKRLTVEVRNQLNTYISDYISEELGFSKKVQNRSVFSTPMAAPDGQIEIDIFEKLTGIRVSQTRILKGAAAKGVAFQEAKVKFGQKASDQISLGAIEIARASEGFGVVQQNLETGRKGIGGEKAYKLLSTAPEFSEEWRKVQLQINEKFENLLLINIIDAEKSGKRVQLDFIPNALGDFDATKSSSFLKYFSLNIKAREKRIKDDQGNVVDRVLASYRIESIPKAALRKQFEKKNITDRVLNIHKNAFSTGLKIYLEGRLNRYAAENKLKPSDQKISDLMGLVVALAKELKEGGQTPLSLVSKVQAPNMKIRPGTMNIVDRKKQRQQQKFISGTQISALVRKRLGDKMPKGPRRGPPLAADILTERSGRFRSSVQVIPDYRRSIMAFFYDPIYRVFNNTPRDPDRFVGETVREVVQGLYSRAFYITRT